jgi:murein DD-endopeptidase MepM/ murein hydrolase activator NlpD
MRRDKPSILAQSRFVSFFERHGGVRRWIQWNAISAALSLGAVALVAHLHPDAVASLVRHDLSIPVELTDSDVGPAAGPFWREEQIRRGDTVGVVLARMGVKDRELDRFIHGDPGARPLYRLLPGKSLRVQVDEDGDPLALRYLTRDGEVLEINLDEEGEYRAKSAPPTLTTRVQLRSGEIQSSLFGAADAAGMPDSVTMQLAEIFSGDIDFFHDLRKGDRFTVAYEVHEWDGEPIRIGRVIAAEFVNKGVAFRAFHHYDPALTGPDGGYYTDDGKSIRKAFLRSPMEFSRVTSTFSLARFHPILNLWRAHKGIDYGAPQGTPVRATGDGVVETAGRQGGYGNFILLKHQGTYSTAYGHLVRFASGVHKGARVQQGQVIGYVGATGWATGPHLHYEFRINQVQHDPLSVVLPTALPIPAEKLAAFRARSQPLTGQLALARGQQFASAD